MYVDVILPCLSYSSSSVWPYLMRSFSLSLAPGSSSSEQSASSSGVPRPLCKSLVEQCVAFIACDFEFCLRARLVLPDHLYNRVLHHTFNSKLA
jgi:hypothetical protein